MSQSEDLFNIYNSQKAKHVNNLIESDQSTSYEVFRNNTTAVEVIVKEVPGNKKNVGPPLRRDVTVRRHIQEDVQKLQNELNKANNILEQSRQSFQICIREMQKQLDFSNQREMELQTKYLNIKLENEKLKTFLMSKTNLVKKLSKELGILKRIIKTVVKNMINVPKGDGMNVSCSSDPEYDDFENNLKREFKFAKFDESITFDSTVLKEAKNTCEKRIFE